MPSTRVDINAETVKQAIRLAAASVNSAAITDFFDIRQHYLQLRQRGKRVAWYVRARGRSQLIGTAILARGVVTDDYLNLTQARDKAASVYAGIMPPEPKPAETQAAAWTWADLDREYQESLKVQRWVSGSKVKPPNKGTMDDVRLALSKPSIVALGPKRLPDLKPRDLILAIEEVHQTSGHRQCAKCLTYVKSALSWALSDRMIAAGIEDLLPWWAALKPPKPSSPEMTAMKERSEKLVQAKTDFTVGHLAELLVIHESFCAGKVGNEKVSPGIRWGLWWLAFTANRRFSTTVLERARLRQVDEFGLPGWGRAEWPAEAMKAKSEFWLPIPPEALHVANSCMSDWKALVTKSTSQYETTRWVFASTRRIGRDPDNRDVSIYPNSLNHHLRNLRGDKGVDDTDLLKHLPAFWLHLVRSVSANYLETRKDVPDVAASLMLAHQLPGADKDKAAPTTQKFYLTGQRMDQKLIAMKAWSEALMQAYYAAGGAYPQPSEEGAPPQAQAAE